MISISGTGKIYEIDLSESVDNEYALSIDSNKSINITYVSNKDVIYAYVFEKNKIFIEVNKKKLTKEGLILLKDLRKNEYKITLKPDYEAFRERNYIFKLGKHNISGNSITFNITSKENGNYEPWSVITDMSPISYDVDKKKTKVTLTMSMILATESNGSVIFRQDNSGKEIKIKLKHVDNNSVELYETKEAD